MSILQPDSVRRMPIMPRRKNQSFPVRAKFLSGSLWMPKLRALRVSWLMRVRFGQTLRPPVRTRWRISERPQAKVQLMTTYPLPQRSRIRPTEVDTERLTKLTAGLEALHQFGTSCKYSIEIGVFGAALAVSPLADLSKRCTSIASVLGNCTAAGHQP